MSPRVLPLLLPVIALLVLPSCRHKASAGSSYNNGQPLAPYHPQASSNYGAMPRPGNQKPLVTRTTIANSPAAAPKAPKGWNGSVPALTAPAGGYPNVSYSHGSRGGKYLALTFDDGPHGSLTPQLLDILASRNVKATFFVLGPRVKARPDLVQRMVTEGHEVGNHSSTHKLMTKMSDEAVLADFRATHDAVVGACGVAPKLQRPPYGSMNARQRAMLKDQFGYSCILWEVDPLDWKRPGSGVVASRIISGAKNGSILLMHDIHAGSVEAVPQILDTLIAQGYTFVTVSQLLSLSGQ